MHVKKSHEENENENNNLNQGTPSDTLHHNCPWIHENQLHIENQKDEREEIVADIELIPRCALSWDTAFVSFTFRFVLRSFH